MQKQKLDIQRKPSLTLFQGEFHNGRARFRSSLDFPPRVKKIKIKSNGQECPLHTSKIKVKIKSKVKGDGQECSSHTVRVKVPPLRLPLSASLGASTRTGQAPSLQDEDGAPAGGEGGFEKRRPSRPRLVTFLLALFRVSPSRSVRSDYQKNCMY